MFFEKEIISFHILNVLELKQQDINMFNTGRNFNALSFRFRSDAVLKTDTGEYPMRDSYIAYVPAHLDYSRIAGCDELIAINFETIDRDTKDIEFFVPQYSTVLSRLFRQCLDCWNQKDTGYQYRCAAILNEILAECHVQNFNPKIRNSKIQNSIDYIMKNYTDPDLSIAKIAKESFMSEVCFRKLFKQEYGISPQKYIIDLRIQHAVELISTGYYSLKEVAYMSGYSDYKYFSVEFKRITGESPSKYSFSNNID